MLCERAACKKGACRKKPGRMTGRHNNPSLFSVHIHPDLHPSLPGTEPFPSVEVIVIDFSDFDCTGALPSLPETQNG